MSNDIKVTDGTVLEVLNNKIDLDGGNYKGSELEAYIHEHCTADCIKTKNITNCITEIPQRIKYILEDGTLTIKAGSVLTIPYGKEDKTNEFPVGSSFLTDKLKVVDTQYKYDKFIVWAEVINDSVVNVNLTNADRYVVYNFYLDKMDSAVTHNASSGETAPTSNGLWYDTANNFVYYYYTSTQEKRICSLPLSVITTTTTTIEDLKYIFNDYGYIGSVTWMNKGIKGLIPNGKNINGTFNNAEYISDFQIHIKEGGNVSRKNRFYIGSFEVGFDYFQDRYNYQVKTRKEAQAIVTASPTSAILIYIEEENINACNNNGTLQYFPVISGVLDVGFDSDYNVTSFEQLKQPFRALDYSQINEIVNKEEIMSWSMPDYSSAVAITISGTYTVPYNGILYLFSAWLNGASSFTINGASYSLVSGPGTAGTVSASAFLPVNKGDKITFTKIQKGTMIPLKGAK
jgi:hypothetical protein